MGVYHISGLGLSPGAVTVPLTIVFLKYKFTSHDQKARDFFASSGEKSNQDVKGFPEALILFTSKEVINGEKKAVDIKDDWFTTPANGSVTTIIYKYFRNLIEALSIENLPGELGFKYVYFVEVDHKNFEDCFKKAYLTFTALKDKEVWVNLVGGTNQINAALLVAGSLTGISVRDYYVFQEKTELLHPKNISNPNSSTNDSNYALSIDEWIRNNWVDLPFLHIDISSIFASLMEKFREREKLNVNEVKNLSGNIPIVKLVGAQLIQFVKSDSVKAGPKLEYWNNLLSDLNRKKVDNYSDWLKLFSNYEGKCILYTFENSQIVPACSKT